MTGIKSWGGYIPRRRMDREAIAQANVWFDGSLRGLARGERSMCNWDEDAITMAVEAGRDAAPLHQRGQLDAVYLGSTTLPFLDRHNAGLACEAMNVAGNVRSMDVAGTQRAGTSALLAGLDAARGGQQVMVIGSDHRRARVGTAMEMLCGDGAAALVLDNEDTAAEFIGSVSLASDFIDHFRTAESEFDYGWEERWIRDEGYLKLIPRAMSELVEKTGIALADITHLIVPSPQARIPASLAKTLGIEADVMVDNLIANCGDTGAAHPLLLLTHTLDTASTGDLIAVVGFGQGVDAMLFRVTEHIGKGQTGRSIGDQLASGVTETNYAKFQTFNGVVDREYGKRAETDTPVRPSAHYRNRHTVNSFIGSSCNACGTIQFPKSNYCVNPDCGQADTQDDYPLSDTGGRVVTFTADRLTFSMDPPSYFGLVEFEGGARANLDFTEVDPDNFDVDTAVSMHFRVKQFDALRGFRSYFWKAAPIQA